MSSVQSNEHAAHCIATRNVSIECDAITSLPIEHIEGLAHILTRTYTLIIMRTYIQIKIGT